MASPRNGDHPRFKKRARPALMDEYDEALEEPQLLPPKKPLTAEDAQETENSVIVKAAGAGQRSPACLSVIGHLFDNIFAFLPATADFRRAFSRLFLTMDRGVHLHLSRMTSFMAAPHTPQCTPQCHCALIPSILGGRGHSRRMVGLRHLALRLHPGNKHQTKAAVLKQPSNLLSLDMSRCFNVDLRHVNGTKLVYGLSSTAVSAIPSAPTLTSLSVLVRHSSGDVPLNFGAFPNLCDLSISMLDPASHADRVYSGVHWPPSLTRLRAPHLKFTDSARETMPHTLRVLTCDFVSGGAAGWHARFHALTTLVMTSLTWADAARPHGLPRTLTDLSAPIGNWYNMGLQTFGDLLPASLTTLRRTPAKSDPAAAHVLEMMHAPTNVNTPNLRHLENVYVKTFNGHSANWPGAAEAWCDALLPFSNLRSLSVTQMAITGSFTAGLRLLGCLEELTVRMQPPIHYHSRFNGAAQSVRLDGGDVGPFVVPCTPSIRRVSLVERDECFPNRYRRLSNSTLRTTIRPFDKPRRSTVVLPHDGADMASLQFVGLYGFDGVDLLGYNVSSGRPLACEVVSQYSVAVVDFQLTVMSTTNMFNSHKLDSIPGNMEGFACSFVVSPNAALPQGFQLAVKRESYKVRK